MDKKLASKPADETWYVVKSVDTMPSEDMGAPFVPNYIIFVAKSGEKAQAPRLSMVAAKRDDTMDPEAFIADDIVDMKGSHHWRRLQDHQGIFVLCDVNEDTGAVKAKGFASGGGFKAVAAPAASTDAAISFGSTAPAAPISFGNTAPANTSFSFGNTAPAAAAPAFAPPAAGAGFSFTAPAAPAAEAGFSFTAPAPGAEAGFSFTATPAPAVAAPAAGNGAVKRTAAEANAGDDSLQSASKKMRVEVAPAPAEEPPVFDPNAHPETVFPVLWQPDTITDLREEIAGGMKVIFNYESGETKIRCILENDFDFLEKKLKTDTQKMKVVKDIVKKHVLRSNEEYRAVQKKYNDMPYTGEEDHERNQAAFQEERAEITNQDAVQDEINAVMEAHSKAILKELKAVCLKRKAKLDHTRDLLTGINKGIKSGHILERSDVQVVRVFPAKDSFGEKCAFRPSKRINKSVGGADVCIPDV